jgi:hypothetical protein
MTAMLSAWVLILATSALPTGPGKVEVDLGTLGIEVYTYKPASYRDGPMLVVFHGMDRNAEEYRDHARGMADRFGMLLVAPRFDRPRFPDEKYNRGGLFEGGKIQPRERWTWPLVPKLVDELRRREGRPDMPYYFIGHSAGAQFAERLAGFVPTEARRIVVANAGVHLFPTRDLPFSFGFGTLPEELGGDEAIRRYLAQPLTIYLGTADTLRDRDLFVSRDADREGENRYLRGQNAFHAAESLAKAKGWTFGWRLVEAPGVGHDHQAMFDDPACASALFGEAGRPDGKPSSKESSPPG